LSLSSFIGEARKLFYTGVNTMNHRIASSLALCLLASIPSSAAAASAALQPPAEISLDPAIECWSDSAFPVLGAQVIPPEDIVRSRLYFRCSLYPDYYFVDLTTEGGAFRGVAPQADAACPQVHYYVEAIGRDFTSVRTEERVAQVAPPDECRRRDPAVVWFAGEDPNIFLGSTLGTTGMAPGFKTVGIAGFISSTGGTIALSSGGLSTGAIAGIAAGGAAAAGLGVLATGGNTTTTTAPVIGPPPSTSTTTAPATTTVSPAPSGLVACFTLDPADGRIRVGEPLRIDGRCSQGADTFRYDLGDGRTREGQAFITPSWPHAGDYRVTLTVSRNTTSAKAGQALEEDSLSREIHVEPEPVTADFTARRVDSRSCIGEFDGSSSQGNIVQYLWELDLDNDMGHGLVRREGSVVRYDWKSGCFEFDGRFRARLTVVGEGGSHDAVTKDLDIFGFNPDVVGNRVVEGSFASEILEGRGIEGQVIVEGGRGFSVSAGTQARIQFRSSRERVGVETVATRATEPFLWRFDFSGVKGFVPGSLRVLSGQEVARDAHSVVLRFSGAAYERARFEYRLSP
jgi:hypothetical protein